jgi:hypothetical protein
MTVYDRTYGRVSVITNTYTNTIFAVSFDARSFIFVKLKEDSTITGEASRFRTEKTRPYYGEYDPN